MAFLYHRIVSEPREPEVRERPEAANKGEAASESPLVPIPVTAEEVARQKRRKILTWVASIPTVLAVSGWIYKRSTDPIRAQQSFDAGQRLYEVARYDQAIVACDRAIALKSDFADAYMLRGRAYIALYDPEHAKKDHGYARYLDGR